MTEVIITGKFEGFVLALYGEPGIGVDTYPPLVCFDVTGGSLTDKQKHWLLNNIPLRLMPGYEQAWGDGKLKFAINERAIEFEADFWKPYNQKVNKERTLKEWDRLRGGEHVLVVAGMRGYLRYLGREKWRNKADPETFLKKQMWKTNWDNL